MSEFKSIGRCPVIDVRLVPMDLIEGVLGGGCFRDDD